MKMRKVLERTVTAVDLDEPEHCNVQNLHTQHDSDPDRP